MGPCRAKKKGDPFGSPSLSPSLGVLHLVFQCPRDFVMLTVVPVGTVQHYADIRVFNLNRQWHDFIANLKNDVVVGSPCDVITIITVKGD